MTLTPGARVRVVRITGAQWACMMRNGDVGVIESVYATHATPFWPVWQPGRDAYSVRRESDGHVEVMTADELEPMEG